MGSRLFEKEMDTLKVYFVRELKKMFPNVPLAFEQEDVNERERAFDTPLMAQPGSLIWFVNKVLDTTELVASIKPNYELTKWYDTEFPLASDTRKSGKKDRELMWMPNPKRDPTWVDAGKKWSEGDSTMSIKIELFFRHLSDRNRCIATEHGGWIRHLFALVAAEEFIYQ